MTLRRTVISLFVLAALGLPLLVLPALPVRAASAGPGCGRPGTPGLPIGQSTVIVPSGGLDRVVEVVVPSGYDGRRAVPLVLDLHGSNSSAAEQLGRSELSATAEAHTFVLAAPQGAVPTPSGNFSWNVPVSATGPDDVQFLSDVIAWLGDALCIDARRVYGAGYSGGGRMISHFACTVPDRLAAIAAVAGLRAGAPRSGPDGPEPDPATCAPGTPVPVVTFHGSEDFVNPFSGGGLPYWQYGVEAAQRRWAELNGCRRGPLTEPVTANVSRVTYTACRQRATVALYVVDGGGHTWPGSEAFLSLPLGPVTMEIEASEAMWTFFAGYRRPAAHRSDLGW